MYATVSEASIGQMVDRFYDKVRADQLLGPVFAAAIGNQWNPHLEKMKAFWASALLSSGAYKGSPMLAHLRLPRLTQPHFERWLELWRETAGALCSEQAASVFIRRAETMGERLLHAISVFHESAGDHAARAIPHAG